MPAQTSIVIVNFNQCAKLQRMLESLKMNESLATEVVVVDNASLDDSISMMRERFPTVRIVTMKRYAGFFAGVRAGLKHAHGEVVVVCQANLMTTLHALAELADQLRAAASRKAVAMLPRLIDTHGNRVPNVGTLPTLTSAMACELSPCLGRKLKVPSLDHVADHEYATFACCALDAGFVQNVGGIDNAFYAGFGDADLAARFHDKAGRLLVSKDVTVVHDPDHKSDTQNVDRLLRKDIAHYFERNRAGWERKLLGWTRIARRFITRAAE